ncbi:LytTR family transcriptional regulator DNA-binding domain-containing protein [Spirosoma sp. RP8]|uniref:LytTR family transcriptional regulator DNA-binding domain-containing protein n=1 Tax=Spirosoma liriopis TaxID=2937440 RepID=A0ABT0HP27_9BACT|nr:LytTR family transcriptional regulator DNA-binding domain-containing protein [Spirosoma liriopis]MCK8493923.1 LytTR family transcriptional regulator DNA-binding domain-containing protein [Spirosoma liriopis]
MSTVKPALQEPALISHLAGANNYSWLYFRNGEKKMLAKSLSYLHTLLTGFVRVHKTALINPVCVKSLQSPPSRRMPGAVQLENGVELPVSRRRWQQVAEVLQPFLDNEISDREHVANSAATTSTAQQVQASILLVTDETDDAQAFKHIIETKWPRFILHAMRHGTLLPEMLADLPAHERPALILMDARKARAERLHALRRLKELPNCSRIPVLLITPTNHNAIAEGYERYANSVIALPDQPATLVAVAERIGQFWLQTVALPIIDIPDNELD